MAKYIHKWRFGLGLPLVFMIAIVALAIAGTPGSSGDTTADFELGQIDFSHNAPQFPTARSLDFGGGNGHLGGGFVAIDTNSTPNHLYVADPANNRILAWNNAAAFTTGQVADLIVGQLDQYSIGSNQGSADTAGSGTPTLSTLSAPTWLAVDSNHDLWVSDAGNLRVLEYPNPFTQVGTITASHSYGFNTPCATNNGPGALAFDAHDNLYLGTASGLVEEFNSGFANLSSPDLTIGTALTCGGFGFTCQSAPIDGSHLCGVAGITVGGDGTIYVADGGDNRVMVYDEANSPPTSSTASFVIGQSGFTTKTFGTSSNTLKFPADVKLDSGGNVYVTDGGNSRALEFNGPSTPTSQRPRRSSASKAVS